MSRYSIFAMWSGEGQLILQPTAQLALEEVRRLRAAGANHIRIALPRQGMRSLEDVIGLLERDAASEASRTRDA